MKKKNVLICLLFLLMVISFASCASAPTGSTGGYKDVTTSSGVGESGVGSSQVQPGQITASAYDDNKHFDEWEYLITPSQTEAGVFQNYYNQFSFKTLTRIEITVPMDFSFKVNLLDEENKIVYSTMTDVNGKCYLFSPEYHDTYNVSFEYYEEGQTEPTVINRTIGQTYYLETMDINQAKLEDTIQLMFVIDTTGSMGDEINYLKAEVIDIIEKVKEEFKDTKIELAMMVYRDKGDAFITKYSDFTQDISTQINFLSPITAVGGGDFEEAVDIAMTEVANKQWSEKAKTKLLIHVADAPAHDQDVQSWNNATLTLASKGVRIITVASSGIDKKTEYFFRSQSILTQGQYVFITDHSGIGGSHLPPTIKEELTVEYLNSCLVRLIKGYHRGYFEAPVPYNKKYNEYLAYSVSSSFDQNYYYEITSFEELSSLNNKMTEIYDEKYFENNSLVVFVIFEPSISYRHSINTTGIKEDGKLTLKVIRHISYDGSIDACAYWFVYYELTKAEYNALKQIEIVTGEEKQILFAMPKTN